MVRKELKKDFEEQYKELLKEEELMIKRQRNLLIFVWVLVFFVMLFYTSVIYLNYKNNEKEPKLDIETREQVMIVTYYNGNAMNETYQTVNYMVENNCEEELTYNLKFDNIKLYSEEVVLVILKDNSPYKEISLNSSTSSIAEKITIPPHTSHNYEVTFKYNIENSILSSAIINVEIEK